MALPAYAPPAINFTPPPRPSGVVGTPANKPIEDFDTGQLDPTSPTFIWNKYRPSAVAAGAGLRQSLAGFGNYNFTEDPNTGITGYQKQEGGQPGQFYSDAYFGERARANARGMLYSSFADDAISRAWTRLGDQEQGILNQYGSTIGGLVGNAMGDYGSIGRDLSTLYGQDAQSAIDTYVPPPQPADASHLQPVGINSPLGMQQNASAFKNIDARISAPKTPRIGVGGSATRKVY